MSAYIVDTNKIQAIVNGINFRDYASWLSYNYEINSEIELGQRLMDMNREAVNQRYRETDQPEQYQHKIMVNKPHKAYMACDELLYQCSEGDVYESKDFRLLEKLQKSIGKSIIKNTPEYEYFNQQGWG